MGCGLNTSDNFLNVIKGHGSGGTCDKIGYNYNECNVNKTEKPFSHIFYVTLFLKTSTRDALNICNAKPVLKKELGNGKTRSNVKKFYRFQHIDNFWTDSNSA